MTATYAHVASGDRLRRWWRLCFALATLVGLPGCINAYYQAPHAVINEQMYASFYPYFAEYCALSEFDKKPGFGIDLHGAGPGGHSVFYLNGACRVPNAGYPALQVCDESPGAMAGRGVGLSVNDHFRNTKWTATDGRGFFYYGAVAPGNGVTRAGYERTQQVAKAKGILDGVVFHREALEDKPKGMSLRDYMYDISVGTDYAVGLARDRYCARVPLDRGKMDIIVHYLNELNAPYRSGQKVFEWNVLRDNCAYLAHNALAAVGLWAPLRQDRPLLIAAFNFPVPKNEFVNLMRQTNDMPIADPGVLYDDEAARSALLQLGWVATQPGALAEARPAVQPNEVYQTHLRLIFYDEPIFGHYQEWFDRIFAEPRYTHLTANLLYFRQMYSAILAQPRVPQTNAARAVFYRHYYDVIAADRVRVDAMLAKLSGGPS